MVSGVTRDSIPDISFYRVALAEQLRRIMKPDHARPFPLDAVPLYE